MIFFLLLLLTALIMYRIMGRQKKIPWWKRPAVWGIGLLIAMILFSRVGLAWLGMLSGAVSILMVGGMKLVRFLQTAHIFGRFFLHHAPGVKEKFEQAQEGKGAPTPASQGMTREEACSILGVKPQASRDEVLLAHRRLIAKCHPDQGGTDYLAQQINRARDLLLAK
jgi:hypothetical protein